ncbi:putative RING-H2 finger protein ATL69 [Tasmannia lanceolata]|uniref:putative RING-H2 finger protein ATL69 n=1 Tax=Tasmannia lanceolata TaxID=3420 RepID=UPI004062DD61
MSTNFISTPPPGSASGSVGLGYGIAIAVGILVLVSTIMLASYLCVRVKGGIPPESDIPAGIQPESDVFILVTGLDGPTIESYPKFVYGRGSHVQMENGTCPICLSEYKEGEMLRCIPECKHCFHVGCVDEWLRMSATCPMCRNSPVPTPVATPLSELIPLAVHGR